LIKQKFTYSEYNTKNPEFDSDGPEEMGQNGSLNNFLPNNTKKC